MRFRVEDVHAFAEWSGDRNALRTDLSRSSSGPASLVVTGLGVLMELGSALHQAGHALHPTSIDAELRGPVVAGEDYDLTLVAGEFTTDLALSTNDRRLVSASVGTRPLAGDTPDTSWTRHAVRPAREVPANLDVDELSQGATLLGRAPVAAPPALWSRASAWSALQLRTLAACLYATAMEAPGARAVVTRVTLSFGDASAISDAESRPLAYRLQVLSIDRAFRLVRLSVDVATSDGVPVATGVIEAYVSFEPRTVDLDALAGALVPPAAAGARVALVCGGSRGLGASLSAALALRGHIVYASHRGSTGDTLGFRQALAARQLPVEFMQGDAGDPRWCSWMLNTILERHGRLDVLVLNACAPPPALPMRPDTVDLLEDYVRTNLRLAQVPLTTMLPLLESSQGCVVAISSSVVTDAAPLSSASRSLKLAVEGLIHSAAAENPTIRCLVARPARLATAVNDTPAKAAGAMPPEWVASAIVNRMEQLVPGAVDILTHVDEPAALGDASDPHAPPPDFFTPIAATFTADVLTRSLMFWFEQLDIRGAAPLSPYGQVIQTLLDPRSVFGLNTRGLNVVLLRVVDWLRELPAEQWQTPDALSTYLDDTAAAFEQALAAHRQFAKVDTLVVLCPANEQPAAVQALLTRTEQRLERAAGAQAGVSVVVAANHHALYDVPEESVHDPVRDQMAHVPYRDAYCHVLATLVARQAGRRVLPLRKVIVVDCDNTLWRGVVGELGPEGVAFDPHHVALHATLQKLAASGVLVCLCSKNEESDVWEVFETRRDFGLPRDTIVAATINWEPKSQNLRNLAARLNLGLDSFVFLDDNPVECAEVRAGCPDVLTLQWPLDGNTALRLLHHTWELDVREATQEDLRRTAMYKEEFKRQALREQTLTFQDFLDNLQLVVDIEPMSAEDLKRSSQLTLRTNQFNFSTKRRSEAELLALREDRGDDILTVRVRDRFGDYGLVGLVIVSHETDHDRIDTFLLSCRVLGRGVEHRMAAEVGRRAKERGQSRVHLRLDTTKKNKPARDFLLSTLPAGEHDVADSHIDAWVDADWLTQLRYEPREAPEPVAEGESRSSTVAAGGTTVVFNPRHRERHIERTAALSSLADLHRALDGESPSAEPAPSADDVSSAVYQAFASALKMSPAHVRDVDSIEVLGCDSFKIVEISVRLLERFPHLPRTLLFEHRRVSEIVEHIARRSTGVDAPLAPASPSLSTRDSTDIAVVGLHLRCAGAKSADELWTLLSGARSAVAPVSENRAHFVRPLSDTRPHWAGLLDDADVDGFDADFFGVSPREAESMDPQLRWFLEVAWGALEDAGCAGRLADPHTGVFVGVMYGDYVHRANRLAQAAQNPYRSWEGFSIANRLSQALGFDGPSLAVDTACSSSGTALHLACHALRDGDCDTAVLGGVNAILDPNRFVQLGILGILSHTGRCQAFGAEADGTVLGEGVGVVVLRRLADAQARGDRIYAVIKGTGLSTGAGTVGFTAPHPRAQSEAIRRAVRAAGIDPRTISYVETHGTGTALGDPIEVRGLTLAYEDRSLWSTRLKGDSRVHLGSIKPNIGHLEAGAGVMGLIKLALQLHRRQLLPSLTSAELNPQIPFSQLPFDVQRTLGEWEMPVFEVDGIATPMPRRAGLNSFGVGGANAHAILEEAPAPAPLPVSTGSRATPERPVHVLTLSAKSEGSLQANVDAMKLHLQQERSGSLADMAFGANTQRDHFEHRIAVVAADIDEAVARLGETRSSVLPTGLVRGMATARPKVAMLFTGQGSQYPGMGRELYDSEPTFRRVLDECNATLKGVLDHELLDVMFADPTGALAPLVHRTAYTQPLLLALEFAMAETLRQWGVKPDLVIGHSVGEIAAMAWAGALPLDDALTLVAARGRLMDALPAGGQMCSIMTTEARVAQAVDATTGVTIAAVNGPTQIVVAGEGAAVEALAARFAAEGVRTQPLTVSHAFHSHLMDPMTDEFAALATSLAFARPRVPVVSCVTGRPLEVELQQKAYWVRQVRDAVRFVDGMTALNEAGVTAHVEVGPHPVLLGMARHCLGEDAGDRLFLPTMRRDASPWTTVATAVAELHVAGVDVDWRAFDAPYARRRISLPTYAFAHKPYWLRAGNTAETDELAGRATVEHTPAAQRGRVPDTFVVAWRASDRPIPTANARPPAHEHVVVLGGGDLGRALAAAIKARGARVTLVGSDTDSKGADHVVASSSPSELTHLWQQLVREPRPTRIAWLWGLETTTPDTTINATPDVAANDLSHRRRRLFTGLQGVVTTLATSELAATPLTLVTCGAISATESPASHSPHSASAERVDMLQAMVWGVGRTVALEHPSLWGGLIDLPLDRAASAADSLAAELLIHTEEDQLALRGTRRLVARLTRWAPPPSAAQPVTMRKDAAYLVTGGTGALGLHVARWLAARGAGHIVLASRHQPSLEVQSTTTGIEALGARVHVRTADAASAAAVDALVEFASGLGAGLRGVVHAAGLDLVESLASTTEEAFDRVAAAKMEGTHHLVRRTRSLPLDFFVSFSSIAAVLGSAGRGAYGGANAAQDAAASLRGSDARGFTTIAWGPWSGGGMASDASLHELAALGNYGIEPGPALDAMGQLIASDVRHAVVADIDWARFTPVYEARRRRPFVSEVHATSAATSAASLPATPWISTLTTTPPERRHAVLRSLLGTEIANTLGLREAGAVPADRTFQQLGMDSLLAVQFGVRLQKQLGLKSTSIVFDHPTLDDLTAHVLSRVGDLTPSGPSTSTDHAQAATVVGDTEWATALSRVPAAERPSRLEALLRTELARTLGFTSGDEIDPSRSFSQLGVDSLLAVQFASRLERLLGVRRPSAVFDHPTLPQLAAHLLGLVNVGAPPTGQGLTRYVAELEDEVLSFQRDAYSYRRPELIAPRWRWMFKESARRLGLEPRVWLYRDAGRVVAHHGALPVRLKAGDVELTTAWWVDTKVRADFQSEALGPRLVLRGNDDLDFSLSLGQTKQMREILLLVGHVQVAPLETAQLLLEPRTVFSAKMSAPAAMAASLGFQASSAVLSVLRTRVRGEVHEIPHFDARHDALWQRSAVDLPCAVVRDSSYLNWKYVAQPGQEFTRLEIVERGETKGVVVLMFRQRDEVYPYDRAFIVDLIAPLTDRSIVSQLIGVAADAAAERGAATLTCLHIGAPLTRALRRNGFMIREPQRYLLVYPGMLEGETRRVVLDANSWYVTHGDSDIDRP